MTREDFNLRAAGFYLSGDSEEGFKALEAHLDIDPDESAHLVSEELMVWEPFEGFSCNQLYSEIMTLSDSFEELYNSK